MSLLTTLATETLFRKEMFPQTVSSESDADAFPSTGRKVTLLLRLNEREKTKQQKHHKIPAQYKILFLFFNLVSNLENKIIFQVSLLISNLTNYYQLFQKNQKI